MRRIGLALAVLAGLLLAVPALAARPHHQVSPPMPWVGIYTLDASGQQSTNWTLDHEPTEQCDQQEKGSGTESDTFPAGSQGQVFVTGVGSQVVSVAPESPSVTLQILMDRNGSITAGPEPPISCAVGSGGEPGTPPTPDCGVRSGHMDLGITPGGGTTLRVGPFADPAFSITPIDDQHEPEYPYNDCPNLGSVLPEQLIQTDVRFPPAFPALPDAPPGLQGPVSLEGEGNSVEPLTESPDVTGTTSTSFKLHLIRLAALAEVKATSAKVTLGSDGTGSLNLRCPRQVSRCHGEAFLSFDTSGESDAVHHFPAPTLSQSGSLGNTTFSFHGGESHRVNLRIAHATPAFLRSLRGLGLYAGIKLGKGNHAVRYLVAAAHIS